MKASFVKTLLIIFLTVNISFAQDIPANEKYKTYIEEVTPSIKYIASRKIYLSISEERKSQDKVESIVLNYNFKLFYTKQEEKFSYNFGSSFGSNIKFGGFWERYAIINFTPQMFIQPFNFIDIYANHNISYFIPIHGAEKHFTAFVLQGLAVLGIDRSIKFLFSTNNWLSEVIAFAAKNLVINFFIKSSIKNNSTTNPMLEYENYYYSLSIKF